MIARGGGASAIARAVPPSASVRDRRSWRADTRRLLWSDLGPFALRQRRIADAFAAIVAALRRNQPLDGAERDFFALCDAFDGVGASHRARTWRDPQAYFWVRRAFQLIATCVGGATLPPFDAEYVRVLGGDPHVALRRHLDAFAVFVVGAHRIARRTLRLPRPYVVRLPLALPGTDLTLDGAGSIALTGVARGVVAFERDGARSAMRSAGRAKVRVERAPRLRLGTADIVMQTAPFTWPALPFAAEMVGVAPAFQRRHAPFLRRALTLVQRCEPRTFRTLARGIRTIALKPRLRPDFANLSHSELPGAIVCSRPADAYVLAASIVHEVHHHRLFLLEEVAPIFDGDAAFHEARFYSPWREDPRPLQGIFHALYVYIAVLRFWRAVARNAPPHGLTGTLVRDRLARVPVQIRLGVLQLRRHARFTRFGARLFAALADDVARLTRRARALDIPAVHVALDDARLVRDTRADGAPSTVRDALIAHLALGVGAGACSLADAGL